MADAALATTTVASPLALLTALTPAPASPQAGVDPFASLIATLTTPPPIAVPPAKAPPAVPTAAIASALISTTLPVAAVSVAPALIAVPTLPTQPQIALPASTDDSDEPTAEQDDSDLDDSTDAADAPTSAPPELPPIMAALIAVAPPTPVRLAAAPKAADQPAVAPIAVTLSPEKQTNAKTADAPAAPKAAQPASPKQPASPEKTLPAAEAGTQPIATIKPQTAPDAPDPVALRAALSTVAVLSTEPQANAAPAQPETAPPVQALVANDTAPVDPAAALQAPADDAQPITAKPAAKATKPAAVATRSDAPEAEVTHDRPADDLRREPTPARLKLVTSAAPHAQPSSEPILRTVAATSDTVALSPDAAAISRTLVVAQDGQWLDALAKDIAASASGSTLHFKLNPIHLGALAVQIEHSAEGATVRMTSDNADTRRILTDAQPRLAAEARAQGLTLKESSVGSQSSDQRSPTGNSPSNWNASTDSRGGQPQRQPSAPQTPTSTVVAQEGATAPVTVSDDTARYA